MQGLDTGNLSVAEQRGEGGTRCLVLRLWAEHEGPFEATFTLGLPCDQPGQPQQQHQRQQQLVRVTATVLARHKGTPRLKPHVHLEGWSAETDVSDWGGL